MLPNIFMQLQNHYIEKIEEIGFEKIINLKILKTYVA